MGEPRRGHRRELALAIVLLLVIVVVAGVVVVRERLGPFAPVERCSAALAGADDTHLSFEQAENAAIIAGVGVRRGLPARAVTIALVTALQESKLRNLNYGDRDSLGLFQQRPSQGWGTAAQVQNPYYSAGKFYDALVKVRGYQSMEIGAAAQAVQRSGYPDAYDQHESAGRALAAGLTGQTPATFSCVVRHGDLPAQPTGADRLTDRTRIVRSDLLTTYGRVEVVTTLPTVLDLVTRSGPRGWTYASYLVANSDRLGIEAVGYAGRQWRAGHASNNGWHSATGSEAPSGAVRVFVVTGS